MRDILKKLIKSETGAALIEFAFASPVLISALIGVTQIGQILYATSEIRGVVGDAAREVKTDSDMTEPEVRSYIRNRLANTKAVKVGDATLTSGTTTDGAKFRTVDLDYTATLNFIFFETKPITLTAERRVYVH